MARVPPCILVVGRVYGWCNRGEHSGSSEASLALAKGVNAAIVSRRLGHASVAFTLDIYSHVLPQVDAEAAELIAAFVVP